MSEKIDQIDKRIIYRLSQDARNVTAQEIAEEMSVSPGTIRNRIKKLEREGILDGYYANIDYELIEKRLVNLFKCSSSIYDREELARKALQVSGVVNVRGIMTGEKDLHIKAVGKNTEDITRIAQELTELGIDIKDEDLIQEERFSPYKPFGPKEDEEEPFISLRNISNNVKTIALTVDENSPIAGKNLEQINTEGLFDKDTLVITIERENKVITPRGDTNIESGDIVTLLSSKEIEEENLRLFKNQN